MRITRLEVVVLGDPPAQGAVDARIKELPILRIHTDGGMSGQSELFHVPQGVARSMFEGPDGILARFLMGQDPTPPQRLWTRMYDGVMHQNRRGWLAMGIGAADVALWDIYGKAAGRPCFELMGGSERSPSQVVPKNGRPEIVPYATVVSRDFDAEAMIRQQVEKMAALRDLGFRAVKVEPSKVPEERIVELTRRAREALGPDATLCVDVQYRWNDVPQALRTLERLAEYDVFFVETPFPTDALDAYADLAQRSPVPLAAGEHSVSRWEFLDLLDRGGVKVLQPYVTTCGGLTEALRIVELARPRGALVCPGNWSTQLLGAATVHLAAVSPITPLLE